MFENASLQEAYTGALIAGKGKTLNNIKTIMMQTKFKTEEWTRVRFGAGTPWRRCWCVISPPDEKEVQKAQKAMKKKSAYDRVVPVFKGDVKFYDTKKLKKAQPIATIRDAYCAYAIYPQSKPLIEQSTLIKIEGVITIHSSPETTTEGFIFVMPEVRPAVSGFEMLLRFLFPLWDVFALYGRPARLAADTSDTRSLMFAMPKEKRYGYLEILDVAGLIHEGGSQAWSECEWKKQLKQLTSQRISKMSGNRSELSSRAGSNHGHRNSLPSRSAALRFSDDAPMRSTPSLHREHETRVLDYHRSQTDSAPPVGAPFQPPKKSASHQRSASEVLPYASTRRHRNPAEYGEYTPSRLSREQSGPELSYEDEAPPPPAHGGALAQVHGGNQMERYSGEHDNGLQNSNSSETEQRYQDVADDDNVGHGMIPNKPPSPVAPPPAFSHQPGAKPQTRPYHSPELRRANSRMSTTTLSQIAAAGNAGSGVGATGVGGDAAAGAAAAAWRNLLQQREGRRSSEEHFQRGVNDDYNVGGGVATADNRLQNQGMVLADPGSHNYGERNLDTHHSPLASQMDPAPQGSFNASMLGHNFQAPASRNARSLSPSSRTSTLSRSTAGPIVPESHLQELPGSSPYLQNTSASHSPAQSATPLPSPSHGAGAQRPPSYLARKPVPSPSRMPNTPKPKEERSVESLRRHVDVDESTMRRVATVRSEASTDDGSRRYSGDSSHYDTDSVASPSYDSPPPSTQGRSLPILPEKQRTGVLKTVGKIEDSDKDVVIGDVRYRAEDSVLPAHTDIPSIDFGPTQAYKPEIDPSHARSKSGERLNPGLRAHGLDSSQYHQGRVSPGHVIDAYNRSPSRSALVTPEPGHSRSRSVESDDPRRSMAWQPGATVGSSNQGSKRSITPEQFVQQRAAASRVLPGYAHGRQPSSTPPLTHSRQNSHTPPLNSRHSSGDWSALHGRQDALARPSSRGATTLMNAPQDYSQHLSAREQEHVARVTGSPLINVAGSHTRSSSQGGLVGAIEAREQEKKAIKAGLGGQMVQQAIAQRQQQAQNHQYPHPSPQMQVPGQFPITPPVVQGGWGNQPQLDQSWGQQARQLPQQYSHHPQGQYQQN